LLKKRVKDEFLDRFKRSRQRLWSATRWTRHADGSAGFRGATQPDQGLRDIARGRRDRAAGGESPSSKATFQKGYFFQPTIFGGREEQMRVAQEEIFGPVVSVITFKDEDDLIKQANDTIYGLSAGIWTKDITRAHRFAKEIKAGVSGSTPTTCSMPPRPLAVTSSRATAARWASTRSKMYTQVKSVWVDLSGKPIGWFGRSLSEPGSGHRGHCP
jgi:acyl-CoA reductase-like NAD-dependent aldehyde dehydrogenase